MIPILTNSIIELNKNGKLNWLGNVPYDNTFYTNQKAIYLKINDNYVLVAKILTND